LKHHPERATDVQLDEDAIGHRTPVRREGTRFQSPCRLYVTNLAGENTNEIGSI
jgi:hypothetical protein